MEVKVVYIGSDHAGFQSKNAMKTYLEGKGLEVTDLGCFSEEPCDYPDIAREVGEKVLEVEGAMGIAICGSGVGVAIAANKLRGIRAAMINKPEIAETARMHNNLNVLTMGARHTTVEEMKPIVDKFLTTDFDTGERHARRVEKLNTM